MNFLYFDTKQLFSNSPDIFFCLPSTSSIQGKECLNVRTQRELGSIQKEERGEVGILERVEMLPRYGNIVGRCGIVKGGFWISFMLLQEVQGSKYYMLI